MNLHNKKIGFALTGSFCTIAKTLPQIKKLKEAGAIITPIMSEILYSCDTRFGKAEDTIKELESICGCPVINSIVKAEPIGPKNLFDLLIIAPCTGNTYEVLKK